MGNLTFESLSPFQKAFAKMVEKRMEEIVAHVRSGGIVYNAAQFDGDEIEEDAE